MSLYGGDGVDHYGLLGMVLVAYEYLFIFFLNFTVTFGLFVYALQYNIKNITA